MYNRFKLTDREKVLFSLKGKKNAAKRHTIYTFLLSNMTDEQRFQLTAKLCQVRMAILSLWYCSVWLGGDWGPGGCSDPIG